WVAGYDEADWAHGYSFGDLVVGKWNGTAVSWAPIDGVPATPAVDPKSFDVTGWRGGQTAAGDDVGQWASIAVDAMGNPAIAYYDRTHRALKFAQRSGTHWSSHTVDGPPGADNGRYAKLSIVNGQFVIAYQSIAAGGTGGALISKVRIATGAGATPS